MTPRVQLLILIFVIFAGIALRVAMSGFSIINLPPSTDESITQLLADSISRGENYPLLFTGQPYQFPLEAWLMSVFSENLPNNAFGTRIQFIVLGFATTVVFCVLALRILDERDRLPTLALILVPSAYWLTHQSGYFVPQHTTFALLSSLSMLLAVKINVDDRPALLLVLVAGMISGLSVSNHMLAVSVVLGTFLVIVLAGNAKLFVLRSLSFGAGMLIGLIPYFLAVYTIENAYDAVINRINHEAVIPQLVYMVVGRTLPGAMGVYPPYFPDYPNHLSWGIPLRLLFLSTFITLFVSCCAVRLYKFCSNSLAMRWPRLEWPDLFIIISVASIGMMAMNSASHRSEHRYLLPVVWCFPFLVGYAYSWKNRLTRIAVSGLAIALVFLNLVTSIDLLNEWRQPQKIRHHADIPALAPMLAWMEDNDFHYCYASYWLAYRVTYESSGDVLCAPIYNERFFGWPIPYKDVVERQSRVTYLLSGTYGTKFSYLRFEKLLNNYGVFYKRHNIDNHYYAYYDFVYTPADNESLLPSDELEILSNIEQVSPGLLTNGNTASAWDMNEPQQAGQYVELSFKKPRLVNRVDIVHAPIFPVEAYTLRISGKQGESWNDLTGEFRFRTEPLKFENSHPVFGEVLETVRLDPILLDAIRIETVLPNNWKKPWTLSEIRVGTRKN